MALDGVLVVVQDDTALNRAGCTLSERLEKFREVSTNYCGYYTVHCYVLSLSGEHDSDSYRASFLFIGVCASLHCWVTYAPVFCRLCHSGTVSRLIVHVFYLTSKRSDLSCCSCF